LSQRLLATEKRNLEFYGFGRKGFVLPMIETAIDITGGKVPASVLRGLIDLGRDMAAPPDPGPAGRERDAA
jgi:putative hydrolase of the HAD superfamily